MKHRPPQLVAGDRVFTSPSRGDTRFGRIRSIEGLHALVDWEEGGFSWTSIRVLAFAPTAEEIVDRCGDIREGLGLPRHAREAD